MGAGERRRACRARTRARVALPRARAPAGEASRSCLSLVRSGSLTCPLSLPEASPAFVKKSVVRHGCSNHKEHKAHKEMMCDNVPGVAALTGLARPSDVSFCCAADPKKVQHKSECSPDDAGAGGRAPACV